MILKLESKTGTKVRNSRLRGERSSKKETIGRMNLVYSKEQVKDNTVVTSDKTTK